MSNQMNVKSSTDITGVTVNALIEPRESYNQNIIAIDSIVENTLGNFVNCRNVKLKTSLTFKLENRSSGKKLV